MKKNLIYLTSIFFSMLTITSCTTEDVPPITIIVENPGEPDPDEEYIELTGTLQTQTLTKDNKYLLKGQVFVRENSILTIEPGTIIFGDKGTKGTLIIDRGGKIIAEGTANEPIVFTSALAPGSRDRGDWGGIVILGKARTNQADPVIEGVTPTVIFGGDNDDDNSGILKYVRVEFAGIELTPNNETNSITLGGVGRGTTMEFCQVSFGGDDGFEWFGGALNAKHLIAFGMWDDCFDVDYGFTGKVQFGLSVRYGSYADQSGSNIFETDNGPNDNVTTLITTGVFSNITGIGPRLTNSQSINSNYQHAIDMRRRTALTIANSVFVGMPRGIRMNQQSVFDNYSNNSGALLNNYLSAPAQTFSVGTGMTANAASVQSLWNATNEVNTETDLAIVYAQLGLNQNIFFGTNTSTGYSSNATFTVTSGSLTSGASFSDSRLTDPFFTTTTYRGAFGATDWTDGWAEFNPIGKTY
ncbi:MAG: hypothetical protein ACOVQR_11760 [Flavobacterium sp.]|jgi:hypothetical protein|uniref:hypothetical protein n=1 Tax=Flavobacterium sp. TaxID=239 RepID=UPI003BA5B474